MHTTRASRTQHIDREPGRGVGLNMTGPRLYYRTVSLLPFRELPTLSTLKTTHETGTYYLSGSVARSVPGIRKLTPLRVFWAKMPKHKHTSPLFSYYIYNPFLRITIQLTTIILFKYIIIVYYEYSIPPWLCSMLPEPRRPKTRPWGKTISRPYI